MILAVLLALFAGQPVVRTIDVPIGESGPIWTQATMEAVPFVPSCIEVGYRLDTIWQLGFENESTSSPVTVYFGDGPLFEGDEPCISGLEIRFPGHEPWFTRSLPIDTYSGTVGSHDGFTNFGGSSGFTLPWIRARDRNWGEVPFEPGFLGEGPIPIEFRRSSTWWASTNTGAWALSIRNLVTAHVELIFYPPQEVHGP